MSSFDMRGVSVTLYMAEKGHSFMAFFEWTYRPGLWQENPGRAESLEVSRSSYKSLKGVRKMRLDEHLVTGIVLGVSVGLFFTAELAPYTALFLIGSIIMILRYLHAR